MNFKILLILVMFCPCAFSEEVSREYVESLEADIAYLQAHIKKLEKRFSYNSEFKLYRKDYENYLSSLSASTLAESELDGMIASSKLTFHGDEHTNVESQVLLRSIIRKKSDLSEDQLLLFIEWIKVEHQDVVDAYLASEITESELKKLINFDKTWTFSWFSYFSTLKLAKEKNVRVILVEGSNSGTTIRQRDVNIANKVLLHLKDKPQASAVVSYGDYHLMGKKTGRIVDLIALGGFKADLIFYNDPIKLYLDALGESLNRSTVKALRLSENEVYYHQGDVSRLLSWVEFYQKALYGRTYLGLINYNLKSTKLLRPSVCRQILN